MEYRELGRTGVKVSALCLGTMTFGEQNSEEEGHAQLDYALAEGINFIDAAEIYPIPPRRETQGATEAIIGTWLASRKVRDKVLVATKAMGRSKMDWLRKDGSPGRQSRAQLMEAVDGSLRRLKTDYIELYQLHWPDRRMRIFEGLEYAHYEGDSHPIEEILGVLGEFVRSGKVRFVGLSNETPWGTMSFLKAAEQHGLPRIASIQNAFNLVNRAFEVGLAEISYREQVSLLAYSPLGLGYLSGKYEGGALPEGSRKRLFDRLGRYEMGNGPEAISAYVGLARRHGLNPAKMAIAFAASRPFVTSTIIGATTMESLRPTSKAARSNCRMECWRISKPSICVFPTLVRKTEQAGFEQEMPRLFSGIEIPISVARRLNLVRSGLSGARWIDPENYHLTLRFLGDVDGTTARDFAHSLGDIAASPFELKLDGLGSFGGWKPRAIFASIAPSEPLQSLHRAHERAARFAGLPPEPRNFTPHVTVARLRGAMPEDVATYLGRQGGFWSDPFEVSRFVLFSSRASVGGGPYVVEAAYPLEDPVYSVEDED